MKSEGMKDFLNNFSLETFGRKWSNSIEAKICVICGEEVEGFKDKVSETEYSISGMCQKCQDITFEGGE